MSSLRARTVTVVVSVPLIAAILVLLPGRHHLVLNLLVVAVALLGGLETEGLLCARGTPSATGDSRPRALFAALGATLPAVAWLEIAGWVGPRFFWGWFLALVAAALLRCVAVRRQEEFPAILPAATAALLVLVYPGLFLSYLVRLSAGEGAEATPVLVFFFAVVLINDIAAYLAGLAFGRFTRVNLAVSPNKSGAGFAGGFLVSIALAAAAHAVWPGLFRGSLARALLAGALLGALTILGDLVESALKRSAGVKDSGTLIPGRGGVLDSVDSWLLSAVALYYLL